MEFISQIPLNFWIAIITFFVNLILGEVSKKHTKISSKIIPIQTMAIGLLVCLVEYIITKDFNTAVVLSGIASGGTYDLVKAIIQLLPTTQNIENKANNFDGEVVELGEKVNEDE